RGAEGASTAASARGADRSRRAGAIGQAGRARDAAAHDAVQSAARPVRSLADVPAILAPAREAGLTVREQVEVPAGALAAAVDSAGYRVVQEAVTNVLRHAAASTLCVDVRVEDGWLRILLEDDGRG